MAEISSLLGLITDEDTREVLINKMERMFDAAEDEQALINDIGSPTKVAVALIRYADNGVVTPEAAAVIDSVAGNDTEDFETLEELDEQPELLIPDEEPEAEAESEAPEAEAESEAPEAEAEPEAPEAEAEPEAPEAEAEPEAPEAEAEPEVPEAEAEPEAPEAEAEPEAPEAEAEPEAPVAETEPEAPVADDQDPLDLFEVLTGKKASEPEVVPDPEPEAAAAVEPAGGFFEAPSSLDDAAVESEAAEQLETEAFEAETEEAAEQAEEEAPEAESEEDSVERAELLDADEEEEDDEPLTVTKVNTFLAILYFIIPGLVIGLPIFLVLAVLNIAFLVVAAAVITAAVLLVITGLSPLSLPDRLLCFGGAAAAAAVGLVLLWFTIWFLVCVTCGWVRLMTRGGKRFSRKEVEIV